MSNTMELTAESTVGAIAARTPATIRVFQRHDVDFCCGGARTLSDVAASHGLSLEAFLAELAEAAAGGATEPEGTRVPTSLADAPVAELIPHILARYHALLWQELPRLSGMADKVLNAHGQRHPESVPEMHRLFVALRADLEPHLIEEEDVVFPALLGLAARRLAGRPDDKATPLAPFEEGVASLERQHETVGSILRDLRRVTGGYLPPEDACNTFRGLLYGLAELEREVHEHVHLENNVLFPAVARLRRGPAVDQTSTAGVTIANGDSPPSS